MKTSWQLLLNILLAYICKNDFLFGRSLSRSLIIRALWKLWQIIRRFTVAGKLKTLSFLLFIHNSKKKLLKIKKGQVGQISQKWCSYCLRGISNLVLFLEEKIKENTCFISKFRFSKTEYINNKDFGWHTFSL